MHPDIADTGPVDHLFVECPGSRRTGEGLPLPLDLVEGGVVRVRDPAFVVEALEPTA
ncbi:hypothetical protein [Streptomyces sp. NPDC046859]|uniref:hypothetical protein n=1 Tax=Streptomyces sp. NPDC046859 TaxID=3155734 RepID=UPI0033C02BF4